MENECSFLKGEVVTPSLKPKPAPAAKPAGTLTLDKAIDQYKESLIRHEKSKVFLIYRLRRIRRQNICSFFIGRPPRR